MLIQEHKQMKIWKEQSKSKSKVVQGWRGRAVVEFLSVLYLVFHMAANSAASKQTVAMPPDRQQRLSLSLIHI